MNAGSYLWLGLVGLLLALLGAAFAYLTLRRSLKHVPADPLLHTLRRFDAWLSETAPRVHQLLRRRLTLRHWHGLVLTLASAGLFGLIWLFAAITEGWTTRDDLYQIDQAVHERIGGMLSDATVQFFEVVTHFADGLTVGAVGLGLGAFLLYRKDWWRLAALLIVVGLGQGVLFGLKAIFARTRPGGKLVEAGFHSFPSGHSFSAMVLYGFLIFLVWRYTRREALRIGVSVGLVLLIVLVGLSRIVLSVHWVSDVLGGFTIGLAWLVVGLTATRAIQAYRGESPKQVR